MRCRHLLTLLASVALGISAGPPGALPGRAAGEPEKRPEKLVLQAWVAERVGPDEALVMVNGFVATPGKGMGMLFAWGDGTQSAGWFPQWHSYDHPGAYTVTVTTSDDQGNAGRVDLKHTVKPSLKNGVARVELSEYCLGMKAGEERRVDVRAYGPAGQALTVDANRIRLFGPEAGPVTARVAGRFVVVGAGRAGGDAWHSVVRVYVDGRPAPAPINVVATRHEEPFRLLVGKYTLVYLPERFLARAGLEEADLSRFADLVFAIEYSSVRSGKPAEDGVMQCIAHSPPAGGYSGNPLCIGDATLPRDGVPWWMLCVICHEMGHNFSYVPSLFSWVGGSGAFYQETIAEWYVEYTLNRILAEHAAECSPALLNVVKAAIRGNRAQHRGNYDDYVRGGMRFGYDATDTGSHPLVETIFRACDTRGWNTLEGFLARFDSRWAPAYARVLPGYGGVEPIENRVTIAAAALTSVFGDDMAARLGALNFPIKRPLHDDLLRMFAQRPQ